MIKVSNRDGKVEASVSSDFMALYIAVIIIIIIIKTTMGLTTVQRDCAACDVVRPIQKSIGKWEIRPPVKS